MLSGSQGIPFILNIFYKLHAVVLELKKIADHLLHARNNEHISLQIRSSYNLLQNQIVLSKDADTLNVENNVIIM